MSRALAAQFITPIFQARPSAEVVRASGNRAEGLRDDPRGVVKFRDGRR